MSNTNRESTSTVENRETSALKIYSLGIVVEDKPHGTDIVLVSPIESLNIQPTGLIKEKESERKGNKPDLSASAFSSEHASKNYIRAKWIPHSSGNRATSPDVCRNETILIFKFGDVDEFYWIELFREPTLRGLEDATFIFSNKKLPRKDAYDLKSSYWFRVSTREKFVHLHTSKNDGEAAEYDFKIDAKKGIASLVDSFGNIFQMSKEGIKIKANGLNFDIEGEVTVNGKSFTSNAETTTNNSKTVVNNTPSVINKGNVTTSGVSHAKQHIDG